MNKKNSLAQELENLTSTVMSSVKMMNITDDEFDTIRAIVYQKFGINLTDEKRGLVVGRLQKMVKDLGLNSFSEYCTYVNSDKTGNALDQLVNKISTNHTFFYREKDHFDLFTKKVFPETLDRLNEENRRDIKVWCAASSTGEEAYTLAMLMMEYLGNSYGLWDAGVLATDISAKALDIAKNGTYLTEQIERLPVTMRHGYFNLTEPGQCQVKDKLRKEVTFRRFNLMNQTFPFKQSFDIIFCRNVMIYFDQETRNKLIEKLYQFTNPGGYLFIGHSETLGRTSPYEYIMPAVYRRERNPVYG